MENWQTGSRGKSIPAAGFHDGMPQGDVRHGGHAGSQGLCEMPPRTPRPALMIRRWQPDGYSLVAPSCLRIATLRDTR
jgi:hypothetical protein